MSGGNGAGKTALGGYAIGSRCWGFNPITGKYFRRGDPDSPTDFYDMYVVSYSNDDVEQRLKPSIRQWVPEWMYKVDRDNNMWIATDGSWRIFFKSVKQGADAFQGDEIDYIWIDELPRDSDVWSECLSRTFRRLGQILVTMTPWQAEGWLHAWIFAPDKYPQEWKEWIEIPVFENPYYYDCDHCGHPKRDHCNVDQAETCLHPRCSCNDFNNKMGQAKLARQMRSFRGIEYKIRVLGKFLLVSGHPVIADDVRKEHEERCRKGSKRVAYPPLVGHLRDDCRFVNMGEEWEGQPEFKTWCRISVPPESDHEYIIGADSGGGNATGDYHAAPVIDTLTGEQVALIYCRDCDQRVFAKRLVLLARLFNDAFVVPEVNSHGLATIHEMIRLEYGNCYCRQMMDSDKGQRQPKLGFLTNKQTKPTAVNLMANLVTTVWRIYDPILHGEMYHYTWLKQNMEGNHGIGTSNAEAHDDGMTGLFLAAEGWRSQGLASHSVATIATHGPSNKKMIEGFEADLAFAEEAAKEPDEGGLDQFGSQLFEDMGGEGLFWE